MFYVPDPSSQNIDDNEEVDVKIKQKLSIPDYETELITLAKADSEFIRDYALGGNLSCSRIRSIYWRILLNILHPFPANWLEPLKKMRCKYNDLKNELTLDPRRSPCPPDDNPLSQDKNSVWYKYFCDVELRRVIRQDVIRTSPEKKFFQSPHIQEIMIDILFVYARENPNLCYRQGMHEILALLLYVIHEDCQKLSDGEMSLKETTLSDVLDMKYLENDLFYLFTAIMERLEKFYESDYSSVPNACGHFPSSLPNETRFSNNIHFPFEEIEESGISLHVNSVIRNCLAVNDPELHQHLKKLNIPYTVFGIRWLRLLFGREFQFDDLFILWDAIFAIDSDFVLVNHILVAMLITIRNELLNYDYVHCLNQLMNYPKTVDISYIVKLALYLKNPKACKKPTILPSKKNRSEKLSLKGDEVKSKMINLEISAKTSATSSKKMKNIKWNIAKRVSSVYADQKHSNASFSKNYEKMMAELKHMRVVMSLCKLKLYQYHDVLASSIDDDDVKAQHALTGIQELCTLLEIDHFSTKSSPNDNPDETLEARDPTTSYMNGETSPRATADAIALCLPPPKTDIDMTIFSFIEFSFTNASYFPPESPHKIISSVTNDDGLKKN